MGQGLRQLCKQICFGSVPQVEQILIVNAFLDLIEYKWNMICPQVVKWFNLCTQNEFSDKTCYVQSGLNLLTLLYTPVRFRVFSYESASELKPNRYVSKI